MKNIAKNKLVLIVGLGILVVAVVAYVGLRNKNSGQNTGSTSGASNTQSNKAASNVFDPLGTNDVSYVATITTTNGDKSVVGVMESDAKTGAIRYTATTNGKEVQMTYTKDAYYICQSADKCLKYPLSQGSGFDPKSYAYDASKIAEIKNSVKSLGTSSCPTGTCSVWQTTNGSYQGKVYIDSKTKRIVQAENTTASGSSKIVYDYKDVTVSVPANAQELPNLNLPQ